MDRFEVTARRPYCIYGTRIAGSLMKEPFRVAAMSPQTTVDVRR